MKFTSNQIRNDFISFFKNKKHQFIRSSPVMPINDSTLLFTNAGMNQFKNIFLNKKKSKFPRVVNSQKCIRVSGKHNDLEEVGVDQYHHTFFEMLGNWSFGDYYKKEAIIWSWELLTEVWNLDKKRLWVTIYNDDDESEHLWKKHTDVNPDRILRFGKKDNFWEMGESGPCGPCSEIHYYIGKDVTSQNKNGVNKENKYRELWNLVFIEYNRKTDGSLEPLPSKHVDTGLGLERVVATLNNIDDHYQTDLFDLIIKKIITISKLNYKYNNGIPHRVIADHIRMLCFSIADGVMPSNEGRGYVVRRVLRRACRYGRVLKIEKPFLFKLVDEVIKILGDSYSELIDKKEHIIKVIKAEEISFGNTLDRGLVLIEDMIKQLNTNDILSGEDVFLLYDTYGFPIDLTELIAKEKGFKINIDEYNRCMESQKNRGRSKQKFNINSNESEWKIISDKSSNTFCGYEKTSIISQISKYRELKESTEVVCDITPFYAESGGQIGDTGYITSSNIKLKVIDTYMAGDDICHLTKLEEGKLNNLNKNNKVELTIDNNRRKKIKANHTATHLLHKALKQVLGNHIQQAGSLVADNKLRFDLAHYEKISSKNIEKIEKIVNEIIIANYKLDVSNQEFEKAKKNGAEALFGEKYDDIVRVITIGDFSKELCGGTHVNRTGDIGLFKIISEASLAAGIRRIEAITSMETLKFINSNTKLINLIKNKLQCSTNELENKIDEFSKINKENNKLLTIIENNKIDKIIYSKDKAIKVNGIQMLVAKTKDTFNPKLLVDRFLDKYKSETICLIGMEIAKPSIILCCTKDIVKKYDCGQIIKDISTKVGSGGGGPTHFGTAGFKDHKTFITAYSLILNQIK